MARRFISGLAVIAAAMLAGWAPSGAQEFPNRPITFVITFAAGGITDVTARLYAEVLSRNIGQPVVVENRPAGGGATAATAVKNAAPDGHTVLVFSGAQHAALPAMQTLAYDPVKDFAPVTVLFTLVNFLAVPFDSPSDSLPTLLKRGREKSGGLTFGSPGVASPAHLNAVMLSRSSGTPLEYVQYRGSAPMMADLVSGRLDLAMISYTVAKPFVEGKKLKILAQDSNERLSDMPEVPTMVEAGASGAKVSSWFGLAAPAGTPPAVVQKLNKELIKASKDPELVRRLRENGTLITTTSPDEMGRLMVVEAETVGPLVRSIGLTSQ